MMPDRLARISTGLEERRRLAAARTRIDRRLEAAREQLVDRRVCVASFSGALGPDRQFVTVPVGTPHPSGHPVVVKYPTAFRPLSEREIESHLKGLRLRLEWAAGI